MKINKISLLIVLLFFNLGFSQEQEEVNYELSKTFSTVENSKNMLSNIANQNLSTANSNNRNSILVQQIGNQNVVFSKVNSSDSNIVLSQNGESNAILLDKSAITISHFISQNGNYNKVVDFNLNYNGSINSNFQQTGNNLNIIAIGANSISEKMIVKQNSPIGGSVIILNK